MYIVKVKRVKSRKHSAWNTRQAAEHQAKVICESGLGMRKEVKIENDVTVNCENGHYYV